jgi:hypothetical protein
VFYSLAHLAVPYGGRQDARLAPKKIKPSFVLLLLLQSIKLWWGYLRVEANGTQLKCEAVSDLDGRVLDSVTLVKPEGWGEMWRETGQQQQQ